MWRDTVRRQLHLPEPRLDIVTMQLEASDGSEVMKTLMIYGRGDPASWDQVKYLLRQTNSEATFSYTLRALTEDEDSEWEHQGPPLALHNDLCLGAEASC